MSLQEVEITTSQFLPREEVQYPVVNSTLKPVINIRNIRQPELAALSEVSSSSPDQFYSPSPEGSALSHPKCALGEYVDTLSKEGIRQLIVQLTTLRAHKEVLWEYGF